MQRIIHGLFGHLLLRIEGAEALNAINRLNKEEIPFWGLKKDDGALFIKCSVFSAKKVFRTLNDCNVKYRTEEEKGLPFLFNRYRKRVGLLAGVVLSLVLIYASSLFLWDIRLSCNGEHDENKAINSLYKLGVREGVTLSSIDVHRAELSFLIENPEYSDIAINIEGTVACVELRMRESLPPTPDREGIYDIVACRDGIIHSVTATNGEPAVKKGDTVRKGDVLINGVITGKYGASYALHAEGEVLATVYRDFSVVIPLNTTEKQYTGNTESKTSVKILGMTFDFFLNELSPYEKSDAEASKEKLKLFNSVILPITVEKIRYKEYEIKSLSITEDEGLKRAENALKAWMERNIKGEVISVKAEHDLNREHQILIYRAQIEAVEEIGAEKELTLRELSEKADK